MKQSKAIYRILTLLIVTFSLACGTSTGSRYNNDKTNESGNKKEKKLQEDFDISKYKTKINVDNNTRPITDENLSAWYDFPANSDTDNDQRQIVSTINGYRVRVISTDNLDQADSLRNELYSKTNQPQIYIIFDPPFYRIEIGDFTEISSARDLRFKLNQLGYNDARVVNEKVNVYK